MENQLDELNATQLINKARQMAKRHGMRMRKSRARLSIDNCGEFVLMDARNVIVGGQRYDWTPEDVIDYLNALDVPKSPRTKIGR